TDVRPCGGHPIAKIPSIRNRRSVRIACARREGYALSGIRGRGMIGMNLRSLRRNRSINNLQHADRVGRLLHHDRIRADQLLLAENAGSRVWSLSVQAEAGWCDAVRTRIFRPVKNGEDALPRTLFQQEDARLLVFR